MTRQRRFTRPLRAIFTPTLTALLLPSACNEVAPGSQHSSPGTSSTAPARSTHQTIVSGAPAPLDSSVFFLEVTTPSGAATCSAALITPDLLLTAAHCVTGQFGPVDCAETRLSAALSVDHFRVSNEPDLTGAPSAAWTFPELAQVRIVHEGELLCGHDLALLQLAAPLAEDIAIPLGVPQDVTSGSSTNPIVYQALGYGSVHPSGTGEKVRRVSQPLEVQCDSPETCDDLLPTGVAGAANFPAPQIADGEWIGQAAGCPGDSGGPALGSGEIGRSIIGVLSRGSSDCSLNIYTSPRSLRFREAVRDMINSDGSGPIYDFPLWVIEEEPSEPPAPLGGVGGQTAENPVEIDPPEMGGAQPMPSRDVASWQRDRSVGCRMGNPTDDKAPGRALFLFLISLSVLGARRRPAKALDKDAQ